MRLSRAFLITSIFSYTCALLLVLKKVVVTEPSPFDDYGWQIALFLLIILIYSIRDNRFNIIWAGVYGCLALLSFTGVVTWITPYGVKSFWMNLFMALWDLAIAISFVYESPMYI